VLVAANAVAHAQGLAVQAAVATDTMPDHVRLALQTIGAETYVHLTATATKDHL
jgi:hypothetical protein